MKITQIIRHRASKAIVASVCLTAILFSTPTVCLAQQKTERDAVNRLILMVESGESGQTSQAQKLFLSIPVDSKCQPVAAIALGMRLIREREFSDAWKVLSTAPNDQTSELDAVKIAQERLKLWLLLEAGLADKAETQLMKLVKLSIDPATGDSDLAANCGFIGSVAGMLQSDNEAPCIPKTTTTKAIEQLMAKVESTNSKSKLDEQHAENRQWGTELVALVSKLEGLGQAEALQMLSSTQAELDTIRQELTLLRGELKSAGGEKRVFEDQRRKWIQNRKAILQEMARVTPGKPQYPVEPGPTPFHPIEPRGHYQVDQKTLVAKYVPPSASDESRYRVQLRAYDERAQKWRVRLANYQRDSREYPTRMKLWEQQDAARRAALNDQKQKSEIGIGSAESTMKGMQEEIKNGVAKDLKGIVEQQKKLERLVTMSDVAMRYITNKDLKPKRLIRPSSFPLLDYEKECNQLKKSLHELQDQS